MIAEVNKSIGSIMDDSIKNISFNNRRSAIAGLILIGGGIMLASSEGIRGFFGTLFNYGHLSDSYHEMSRTSHDPDIRFGNFSPDGTKVVLNYRPMVNNEEGITSIGILDILTGQLTLIRPPQKFKMWYDGSFSFDGKKMVFSYVMKEKIQDSMGLGILDLSDLSYKIIIKSNLAKKNASFSRDGKRLLYFGMVNDSYDYQNKTIYQKSNDLFELNLKSGKETRLTKIHFLAAGTAPRYFADDEKYIFSAESPYSFHPTFYLGEKFRDKYKYNKIFIFDRTALRTDAIPAIIHQDHSEFMDLSQDGAKILCVALNDYHKYNQQKKYNYELFLYESGQFRQLTDLQWMIIDAALSPDASQAVFVADTSPARGSERQIWLHNLDANATTRIELKSENIIWLNAKE